LVDEIKLIPAMPMRGGALVGVVVIMPALSKG
jgi:hypothetical protein